MKSFVCHSVFHVETTQVTGRDKFLRDIINDWKRDVESQYKSDSSCVILVFSRSLKLSVLDPIL